MREICPVDDLNEKLGPVQICLFAFSSFFNFCLHCCVVHFVSYFVWDF